MIGIPAWVVSPVSYSRSSIPMPTKSFLRSSDRLSNDVYMFGAKSMEAEECAKIFVDRYYRYFGFPRYLTSDRGSDWVSHFWKCFCQIVGITQRLSTAYHPKTNASERANQEMYKYLRAYTCYAQDNWMELLPLAQLAMNTRPNSVIGGWAPSSSDMVMIWMPWQSQRTKKTISIQDK